MKKKDLREFASKSTEEVAKKIAQLQKEKLETNLQIKMGKIKNVHLAGKIKKEIAKLSSIAQIKAKVSQKEAKKENQNGSS